MADSTRKRRSYRSLLTGSAKKRRKKELDKIRCSSRVGIGSQLERWNTLKTENDLDRHEDVAKLLLDSFEKSMYEQSQIPPAESLQKISTPAGQGKLGMPKDPGLSEISMESSETHEIESELSGVETQSQTSRTIHQERREDPSIFIDPFELTIASSEEVISSDHDPDDENYEPNFNINMNLRPQKFDHIMETSFGEMEFGSDGDSDDEEMIEEEEIRGGTKQTASGVNTILDPADSSSLSEEVTFLVFRSALMLLARKAHVEKHCKVKGCSSDVDIQMNTIGSAVYIKWVCERGHVNFNWCSQPVLNNRLHSGELLSSFAVLASGNNFAKVALFAKFLNLHFMSSSTFARIQRTYLVPCVSEFWECHQRHLLSSLKGKVVVAGDGRMDSPGHSAQYCTYSLMEASTNQVLSIVIVDKRETALKSTVMEKFGFGRTMKELADKKVEVGEVITDQHMQIGALMRNNYKHIKHSYDVWHAAKNLAKKINMVGNEKDNKDLLKWTTDIANHFWYSCQLAENEDEFRGIWLGVIHHVVDEHCWVVPYGANVRKCQHGPLEPADHAQANQRKWLQKGGPAHLALEKIVLDKNLLKKIPYFLNFRSTSQLENFNQLVLMYAGKRFAYSPPVYRCRNLLAALDNNHHANRAVQLNKDGSPRYHRVYNKKTARWTVRHVKVKKDYEYINKLKVEVLERRLSDNIGMQHNVEISPTDPRRISSTIASSEPPPTADLVQSVKSRLVKD